MDAEFQVQILASGWGHYVNTDVFNFVYGSRIWKNILVACAFYFYDFIASWGLIVNFEEWYAANKEALVYCTIESIVAKAFRAGFESGFDKGYECKLKSEN